MTDNKVNNSQSISECKGKTNTKGTSFMGKWGYTIFLFVGNIVLYAVSFRVFSAQKLQFFLLAIAFVIVNDLYIVFENNKAYKEVSVATVKAITKIRLYEAIGTVEECREAMEKQTPKTPNTYGDGYDNEGNMIYDVYECPCCGEKYEIDYDYYKYCPKCGQAIDRSNLE